MSILNDNNMIRAIISDHYAHPHNKVETAPEGYLSIHMDSESCVDDFYIYLKLSEDKNIVEDVKFSGVGCTISTASISILTDLIIGKDVNEAKKIISQYHHMLHNDGDYDEDTLEELIVFENTYKQANRIKCASIGADGIEKILEEK